MQNITKVQDRVRVECLSFWEGVLKMETRNAINSISGTSVGYRNKE